VNFNFIENLTNTGRRRSNSRRNAVVARRYPANARQKDPRFDRPTARRGRCSREISGSQATFDGGTK
jgi:hypothetical protein